MKNSPSYEFPSARHRPLAYPFLVCISALLATPLLQILLSSSFKTEVSLLGHGLNYVELLLLYLPLFIPCMMGYQIVFWALINAPMSGLLTKFLAAIACILLLYVQVIALACLFSAQLPMNITSYVPLLLFSFSFLIFSLCYKLKDKKS